MTTGFAYKTSEDPGAPPLTRTAGSFIAVMDWLLDPQYWDKPFSGTHQAVYRAKAGTRRFLQMDDSGATWLAARVRAFTDMTGVATGTGAYPSAAQCPEFTWYKVSTTAGFASPYRAIVTDRFVMIFISASLSGHGEKCLWWFGDCPALLPDASAEATICGAIYAPTSGMSQAVVGLSGFETRNLLDAGTSITFSPTAYPNNSCRVFLPEYADGTAVPSGGVVRAAGLGSATMASVLQAIPMMESFLVFRVTHSSTAAAILSHRVPFLFQLGTPATFPSDGDTYEDVDGAKFRCTLPTAGTVPNSSYPNFAMMINDFEQGLP